MVIVSVIIVLASLGYSIFVSKNQFVTASSPQQPKSGYLATANQYPQPPSLSDKVAKAGLNMSQLPIVNASENTVISTFGVGNVMQVAVEKASVHIK